MSLFNLTNQQVARLVSKSVYENLYQDLIHKEGFGLAEKFVTPEQTNASMVDIYVPIPIQNRFRMRGAESNGAWANVDNLPDSNTGQRKHVLSKRFTIDILKRYDNNIAISEEEIEGTNAASLDKGFEQICKEQIEQDIAININGYTFASQLYSFFMDSFSDTPTLAELQKAIEIYTYEASNKTAAIRAFKLSNAKVSKGDSKLYAGYYPAKARQAFLFNTTFLVDLTDTAALSASDVAVRMLAQGGMNAFTNEAKTVADFQSGYVGWLDGMPLYEVLQQVKDSMYYYLQLDERQHAEIIELLEELAGFIAPANATVRALRPNTFKTVDDTETQGVIVQPLVKMGCRCLSGNSLKAIFSGEHFSDLNKALESVKKIRDAIKGKFRLPNLSYDEDHLIGKDNYVQANKDGTMEKAVEGKAGAPITRESSKTGKANKKNSGSNGDFTDSNVESEEETEE